MSNLVEKMKTYNFWISLVSAIILLLRIIGEKFNFFVDATLIMDITTGLCGIFVVLGIMTAPTTTKREVNAVENKQVIVGRVEAINAEKRELEAMEKEIVTENTVCERIENEVLIESRNETEEIELNFENENQNVENETNNIAFLQQDEENDVILNKEEPCEKNVLKTEISELLTVLLEKIQEL